MLIDFVVVFVVVFVVLLLLLSAVAMCFVGVDVALVRCCCVSVDCCVYEKTTRNSSVICVSEKVSES